MKYKKLMLVTLVLLAILTIGAVSASDDVSSDNLTVSEDVDEVSVDAFVDDEKISENSEKEVVAVSDDELVSNREGGIDALKSSERDIISNSTDINFNGISLSASDIYEGENANVIYHGPDGEVQITVSNQTFSLIANGGVGTLELYDLSVGYYSVTCGSASTAFNVLPRENEGEENSFELWLDDDSQGFDVSSPDLSGYFIAALTVPENMNGNISIVAEEDIFLFNKALNDFNPNHIRDDHIYDISLSDNGRYIFEDIDDGTVFRFAFLDEEGNEIWNGANYKLVINENIIRFELDAHNPGDHVNIDVSGDELSANDDNNFVWINLPSDVTDGKVIVTSGDYTLFEESVNFEEGTHWWRESDGHYVCSFSPNSLTNWNNLSDEDIVVFAFLDEDGNEVASKEYKIFLGENTIRFEELNSEDDELYIGIWDENDERGILYTDAEGNVISIDAPRDYEGAIFHIYVNDDEVVSWEVEFDDENDRTYNDWDLEALGISQAGEYTIAVEFGNGEYSEILLNKTISVSEFNEDVFRAMIQYTTEIMRLYVPQNAEGTVTIITEKETDDDLEQIHEEIYEITSQDYGEWKVWALSDLGFEADGAFRIFTLTVTNAGSEVYRYRIGHVDGEEQEDGEEEIDFSFVSNDDDSLVFNKTSDVKFAVLYIPDTDKYGDVVGTVYVKLNGEIFATISTSDLSHLNVNNHYPIRLDLSDLNDKDMLTFTVEVIHEETGESENNEWTIILEDNGTYFIGHDDIDLKRLRFDAFYGNLTTGTTNDPDLMGPKFDGRFVIITISNALNITEGTVTVNDGTTDIFSKSLSECDKEYDYGSVGYTYFIGLDEIMDMLPEGKDILVSFTYGVNSLIQKRIRFDDYLYKVVLKEDIEKQFHFEVSDDLILHESDTAIHFWSDSDRQSIYIDLGGGYFIIYVNGKKVENLGNVSFNNWKDNFNLREEDRSYWGRELELFRLVDYIQGALPELDITLADLGINESGTYNIRIVHYPSVPGGLDDHSNKRLYAEEYFILDYTEVFNGNITCNLNPDYAGVVILNESRYQHGVPFLFTFKFGDNVLSESNRILIYINDELAFNCTTLFYAEDGDGEMELCDLWKVTPGEFNKELLNEYGFLDVGDYNAVVYLVKGSDEPVEIGSGTFTVVKQKGDMNFTMGSTTEDDGIHTIIYADIPEGDWDGYSLEIIIGDSEKIVPDVDDVDDWFPRWYNEYAIFKDNQIYSKESLEDIIGKGPVAIDLGVLDEGTHIWVEFGHGEETVYGDWDFYQNDFTVKAASVPADSDLKVTVENINFGETAVVNIEMDEAINGEVLVSAGGFNYTVTVTNGKASQNISGLKAGTYDVAVKFEGNDDYNPVENTTSFKVTKLTPVIEITAGEAIEGSDLEVTVTIADATGSVDVNGEIIALVDGKASTTIKNLVAGELNVTVVYSGDAKYVSASDSKKVSVKAKDDAGLVVSVEDIEAGQIAVVNIEINANVTGKVTIYGNEIAIINGKGSYNLSDLEAGLHNVTVVFGGDKYFNADEKTTSFNVAKLTPIIEIDAGEAIEGGDLEVTVTIADATGSVEVNGEIIALVDGKATLTIENVTAGILTVDVVYYGDEKYLGNNVSINVTVMAKRDPNLVVSVSDINFGEVAVVNIELNPEATGKVTVNGDEVDITDGKVEYNITGLTVGNHTITVAYAGDKYFNADEKTANIAVKEVIVPADPQLIIGPIDDVVEGTDVTVVVSANETFTGNVKVFVGVSEVATLNMVNGKGSVTIGADKLNVGANTVKVTSEANEYFFAGEDTTTFTVTLTKTVTKETFNKYFNVNGVYVADLDEIIFAGEFTDIPKITITKAVNITGQNARFTDTVFSINSDNVSVKGLTINAALTDYAITVTGSGQVSLIGNSINAINGILISECANFTIDSNSILSTAGENINGIYINRTGSGIVKNNKLDLKSTKTAYAINTNPTGPLRISYINNTIVAESFFAVGIYDDAELIQDNDITLSGNYAIGIAVLSKDAVVDNNDITLSTTNTGDHQDIDEPLGVETAGIKVNNDATITKNTVDSTGKSMSIVGGSSTISENNLNGQVSLESNGNTISDNVITTTEDSAIDASSSTGNTITSNEAYSAQGNGDNAVIAGEGNTVTGNFEKFDPSLTITVADITEGADAVIFITTNNAFSGDVSVKIGKANYTVSVVNGAGKRSVSGLSVATYTAVATFKATDVFTASEKNTTFAVKAKVATAISAAALTTTYATSKKIVVSLKDASGNVLAGKSVAVVFNGAAKTLTTDAKGQVSLAIGTALVPKSYDATFTFAGDDSYAKSAGSVKVTVKKATPKLTAKKKTFKVKKAKKYTIALKTDKNKALSKVKVTITVKAKGKKIKKTVKTNAKGKATFNLKNLNKKGKYTATVKFAGTKYYQAVTKKVKINVKK